MRLISRFALAVVFLIVLCNCNPGSFLSVQPVEVAYASDRSTVFVSDLHWGLGRGAEGKWNPMEDFRWPEAFRGFLDAISVRGNNAVDLIIVGDLLELWQQPESVKCEGHGSDLGCTADEMKAIVSAVVFAHKEEFAALKDFLNKGSNHVYLIPGNHDAALLLPDIWNIVSKELDAPGGRVTLIASGIWISGDGRIVAEHGHQIGSDVNRYYDWPKITEKAEGKEFIIRPWGELFVQKIFNDEEKCYPIIDNLIPETAGLRYRMADRGFQKSAADVARFIAFNLFETSFQQKLAELGGPQSTQGWQEVKWSRDKAAELGYRLFTESMSADDPFRRMIEENSPEASAVRQELDRIAGALPDEDLKKLCANIVATGNPDLCGATLGNVIQKVIPHSTVLRSHILQRKNQLQKELENISIFLYGHTHEMESPWPCKLYDAMNSQVTVVNTGAFQRLLSEKGYRKRTANFARPEEGLRKIPLEKLPPCYTFVSIKYDGRGRPEAVVETWYMDEGGKGSSITPGMEICE